MAYSGVFLKAAELLDDDYESVEYCCWAINLACGGKYDEDYSPYSKRVINKLADIFKPDGLDKINDTWWNGHGYDPTEARILALLFMIEMNGDTEYV